MQTKSKFAHPTHQEKRDKVASTTAAALEIIATEQNSSASKVARLKALRLARDTPSSPEV